jgi:hypothetical protein
MVQKTEKSQELIQFDRMNKTMRDIFGMRETAPPEFRGHFDNALFKSYAYTYEHLSQNPELVKTVCALGVITTELCSQEIMERENYLALVSLAKRGYIDPATLDIVDYPYTKCDIESFSVLFGALVEIEPIEEEIEEFHDESEIDEEQELESNILDIVEYLEAKGFGSAEVTFAQLALQIEPVNIDSLRSSEWEFIAMADNEYQEFKDSIDRLTHTITKSLAAVGVNTKFHRLESRGKVSYKLDIITDDVAVQNDILVEGFGDFAEQAEQQDEEHVSDEFAQEAEHEEFAEQLTFDMSETMSIVRVGVLNNEGRQNMVVRHLAEAYDITRLEARQIVAELVDERRLFVVGSKDGTRILSLEDDRQDRPRARSNDGAEKRKASNLLTEEEMKIAESILDSLIAQKYQDKGLQASSIAEILGIDEATIKLVCGKLVNQNILNRDQKHVKSGAPRSKKNRVGAFITIPDMDAWRLFRNDRIAFLAQIQTI